MPFNLSAICKTLASAYETSILPYGKTVVVYNRSKGKEQINKGGRESEESKQAAEGVLSEELYRVSEGTELQEKGGKESEESEQAAERVLSEKLYCISTLKNLRRIKKGGYKDEKSFCFPEGTVFQKVYCLNGEMLLACPGRGGQRRR